MLFSTPLFLFFFLPLVLTSFFLLPRSSTLQNVFLLIVSLIFYAWGEGLYVLLLLASVLFNYLLGRLLQHLQEHLRKPAFIVGVACNLLMLSAYKYTNFLADNLNVVLHFLGAAGIFVAPIHYPLGISFFTFHAIIYLVNVYTRKNNAQINILKLALYFCFFPQLLMGPIVRYEDIIDQINHRSISASDVAEGARRFIIGLGKKVLLAQQFGFVTDLLFRFPPGALTFYTAWLGTVCFSLQIYFDFSGYSDMAIGLARIFGFHFKENFRYPYIAASLTELWKRWHISLTSLVRDYFYTPLALHCMRTHRGHLHIWVQALPVFLTFMAIGLWHGAAWHFLIFGIINGGVVFIENYYSSPIKRLPIFFRHLYTLILWILLCVLFRVDNMAQAVGFLSIMLGSSHHVDIFAYPADAELYLCFFAGILASTPLFTLAFKEAEAKYGAHPQCISRLHFIRDAGLVLIFFLSAASIASQTIDNFIYFRY